MKFKKTFTTVLVFIIGLSSYLISPVILKANSIYYTLQIGSGPTTEVNSSVMEINYQDVLSIIWSGGSRNATDSQSVTVNFEGNATIEVLDRQGTHLDTLFFEYTENNTLSILVNVGFADVYELGFELDNSQDHIPARLRITVTTPVDNVIPVISGQTTFVANVDEERPLSYFMSFLKAYDETDGDVTDSLTVITDNYTQNIRVLGNHTFVVEASDTAGNKTQATINIRVVDIVAPIISGNTSTVDIGYAETWNIESFRKTLSVTDNYQTMTNADIVIDTDGYTSNKTKLGTYTITFKATDESGNTGRFSKNVRVIDNVAPTFSGPATIATSNFTILTESEVRAQLTAHDFIDGNLTNRIQLVEDNYTGNGNKTGSYDITYKVADNAGNTATHTVTIQRLDEIPPTIWVLEGASIRTTPDTPISRDIIIDILEATGQIQINATTTFSFPLDEYSGNEETPGVYAMTLMARSTTGNESVHSFAIEVLDIGEDPDDNLTREPSDFIKDNMTWLIIGGVALVAGVYIIRKRK